MTAKDIKVVDRGSFFDDVFFKDSWEDFDKAMQNVFDRFDKSKTQVDPVSRPDRHDYYKKLRSDKIDDDIYASQAIQVNEKDDRFQVVMDVRDFNPRDLQVKVIDERIVVEGRYDKVSDDGKSSTSKAFYKEFLLPLQADLDQLSTALSKDGVLTIRAPKKEEIPYQDNKLKYNNASQMIQSALNERLAQKQGINPNGSFDNLSKDMRERLLISDRDSGRGSGSGSPISSAYSTIPSSFSPTPSDAWSTATEYEMGKQSPFQKSQNYQNSGYSEPPIQNPSFTHMGPIQGQAYTNQFNPNANMMSPPPSNYSGMSPSPCFSPINSQTGMNQGPQMGPNNQHSTGYSSPYQTYPHASSYQQPAPVSPSPSDTSMSSQYYPGKAPMTPYNMQTRTADTTLNKTGVSPAVGSGGTATISVKEEDGKRTLTQETSSVVQEKDGFLESKEVSAEVTEKDSQAARREANTRMMKQEEDPEGRFKRQEKADASDVNETCVKKMPDGSVMTVKKSSTSSSNFKQSFSSAPSGPMIDQGFPSGMGSFPNMMGRGNNLMSQMSSDSINSNMSQFSNMSDFNKFPTMPQFPRMAGFSNQSQFPEDMRGMQNRPGFSPFPNMQKNVPETQNDSSQNTSNNSFSSNKSSYSQSFSSSSFDKSQF